jgi:hypothetical protein
MRRNESSELWCVCWISWQSVYERVEWTDATFRGGPGMDALLSCMW